MDEAPPSGRVGASLWVKDRPFTARREASGAGSSLMTSRGPSSDG